MLNIGFDGLWLWGRIWTSDRAWASGSVLIRDSSKRLTVVAYPEGDVMFAISKPARFEKADSANCSPNYFLKLRRVRCGMPLPICWDCKYDQSDPWKRTRHGLHYGECVSTVVAAQEVPLMTRVFAINMSCEFYARDKLGGSKQLRVGSGLHPVGYTSVMIDAPNVFGVEVLLNWKEKDRLARFLITNQVLRSPITDGMTATQN